MFDIKKKKREWVKAAVMRAVRTMAQTAAAAIGSASVFGAVDWRTTLSSVALAGVLSLLTSTAGLPEVKEMERRKS